MKANFKVLYYNGAAVLVGLILSGSLLLFLNLNPFEIIAQTARKIFSDRYTLGEILVKATPLIFTSLAFAFTFKANLFNIGAQGQFYAGALAAVALSLGLENTLPQFLVLLIAFVGAVLAGASVGGLIGLAKAKLNANEFLVSMMSTYVISSLMDYLLRTVLQESKAEYLQTDALSPAAYLPNILPGTRVHFGFILAVTMAVLVWVLLYKTPLGFRIRAVGHNRNAAELSGIRSAGIYTLAFVIAGGLAGMAGLTEVNGVQHMLLRNFNASIGSFGIGIAILANGNPLACIFASLLFGFLNVMGISMGRLPGLSIPASIIDLIEGLVMICVIISYFLRSWIGNLQEKNLLRKAEA